MEKINLTKYGFIRDEAKDFSDDGNRFYCYKVGRVRVSKCTSCGMYFIAARIDGGNLNYEEYSKLPHYKAIDRLNGIEKNKLTEDDLAILFSDCLEYDTEYAKAESKIIWPTIEEIITHRRAEINKRLEELNDVKSHITVEKLLSLDNYYVGRVKAYLNLLEAQSNPKGTDEEFAKNIYKTAWSRSYVKNMYHINNESAEYKNLKEILKF